ncbi:LIM and calponin homology domains-containing protein 1a isoform X7 [Lepisosteus oculatus]|uniref:LIM and calponin homology domains-containing protein 1a isoform X7 n=1 Tax=Lepisosteus oculatus TaxID=7918 RepID=UPI0035F51D1E
MASTGLDLGRNQHQDSSPEPAFQEAQKWIEAVTGRRFGDKDFRSGLENGILLCELLSSIKPGLVKKINRLPTPIAGLDNLTLFLRGCEELGLKGTQLFDPGDLQDTSIRANLKGSDCSRKLKNVLITIYWLGKAANSCASYNGPTLDLKEFEGLLSQMRKEAEDTESPKRGIRDSGYIDCWDSERSDSLSPPRHGRDDSFDSLDSFGSRSRQTPSPDVVIRGSSDGRGSDSETDTPLRKIPDVRKDDMLARRTSYHEPRTVVPFNQYLPNKSNQSAYVPTPLRKKKAEREEYRKSWSTATSPIGGERPFSHPETIREEYCERSVGREETEARAGPGARGADPAGEGSEGSGPHQWAGKDEEEEEEARKLQKLEKAGIRVLPASARYGSPKPVCEEAKPPTPDIILRRDNDFLKHQEEKAWDSEEEEEEEEQRKVPDVEKDDLASRRARMNQFKPKVQPNQFLPQLCSEKDKEKWEGIKRACQQVQLDRQQQRAASEIEARAPEAGDDLSRRENALLPPQHGDSEGEAGGPAASTHVQRDDLAKRRAQRGPVPHKEPQAFVKASITQSDLEKWQRLTLWTDTSESEAQVLERENPCLQLQQIDPAGGPAPVPSAQRDDLANRRVLRGPVPHREPQASIVKASITQSDLEKWQKLTLCTDTSEEAVKPVCQACLDKALPTVQAQRAALDDLAARRARANRKASASQPRFVRFGPVTEIDQERWERLCIAKAGDDEDEPGVRSESETLRRLLSSAAVATPSIGLGFPGDDSNSAKSGAPDPGSERAAGVGPVEPACEEEEEEAAAAEERDRQPNPEKDDMMARRTGVFQKTGSPAFFNKFLPLPGSLLHKKDSLSEPVRGSNEQSSSSGPSCSAELCRQPPAASGACAVPKESPEAPWKAPQGSEEELGKDSCSDPGKENPTEPSPGSPKQAALMPDHFAPVPASPQARALKADADEGKPSRRPSWLDDDLPPIYSHRASVSDDGESVSMIDMRCEEEAILQPHSKARHELLHNLHNKLKEEEDQWQDDLARWKSRRRSASQDLIKKEEERKMMERLMSGEGGLSERRKSIKTYREIVEEKERREKELHAAYRSARTPEEAEAVLQRYTQRFTISEAVLERLQLPRCLERSVSVDPSAGSSSSSSSSSSSAMKYLRQQSLPAPKFTATVEASVSGVPSQRRASSPQTSPTRAVTFKTVPLLTPKPYSQPRNSQSGLKSLKLDSLVRVNGETGEVFNRAEDERDSSPTKSLSSPTSPLVFESTTRLNPSPAMSRESPKPETAAATPQGSVNEGPVQPTPLAQTESHSPVADLRICSPLKTQESSAAQSRRAETPDDSTPTRPTSLPEELQKESAAFEEAGFIPAPSQEELKAGVAGETPQKEDQCVEKTSTYVNTVAIEQNSICKTSPTEEGKPERPARQSYQTTVVLNAVQLDQSPNDKHQQSREELVTPKRTEMPCPNTPSSCGPVKHQDMEDESSDIPAPLLNPPKHTDCWSWDPEEERKRQEKWQRDQERVLQEKYQREQEKLKQEWEKAQREVEEEGRKYHEEELKILEETVAPLTPQLSTLSPPDCSDQPLQPLDPEGTAVRSLANWERKQELLEVGKPASPSRETMWEQKAKEEETEKGEKQRDSGHQNNVGKEQKPEAPATKPESSHSQSTSTETIGKPSQENSQRLYPDSSQSAVSELQFTQEASWSSKQTLTKQPEDTWKKTASLDRNWNQQTMTGGVKRSGSFENLGLNPSKSSSCSSSPQPQSPNRSVSGKKLCSSCGHPLGKGAAMIIETLSLYFHIQCFKCGICKGQLGDTTTGTDVRIRNGLLNCNECYIRSRTAGQPTTL